MKKLIYIAILAIAFAGCEDFLDKTDPTATTFVEFFNDEEDLRRVVYSSYLDVFSNPHNRRFMFYMEEGKSDNAYSRIESDHHQRIANGNFNSNTEAFLWYNDEHMKHMGRLNTFIDNIHVPYVEDESIRQKYQGILEALRVWHYFKLTSRWGDVPFILEPADLVTARQPSTPKQEILEMLFPMALEIAERLPDEEYTSDKYMFNGMSFRGMTMRYALYNERYELAADLAKQIMESGYYELHPVYADLFNYNASSDNNEFIMHLDRASHGSRTTQSFQHLGPHFRTGPGQSYLVPLKALVDSYYTLQGRTIDDCPYHTREEYELDPGLNRDPRYSTSIMGHGDFFYGEEIDIYNPNNPMYYQNERASSSGFWFRKFVDEDDAFRGGGTMEYAFMRYAEVLLSYAEAKIMMNDIDDLAKDCINQVRERAGLDMSEADVTLPHYASFTQQDWIELIRNDRRVELAGEGLRYDDIIRWKIAEDVLNEPALGHTMIDEDGNIESLLIESRSFDQHNYRWPYHQLSLRVNPGLEQNPGY